MYPKEKNYKRKNMQNKKNQSSVGLMIQRLLQAAEHCVRMTNAEQEKIDSIRDSKEKSAAMAEAEAEIRDEEKNADNADATKSENDEEIGFPDFITNLN